MAGERSARETVPSGAAYLCFQGGSEDSEREAWAALLVVTAAGLPDEFLYAGPIRPTPVQSILYEGMLASQVRASLIRSLLRGMRSRVLYFAVSPDELVGVPRPELPGPILVIETEQSHWLTAANDAAERFAAAVEQAVGPSEPLGRARAALAYVVDYERRRSANPDTAPSEPPPEPGPQWS